MAHDLGQYRRHLANATMGQFVRFAVRHAWGVKDPSGTARIARRISQSMPNMVKIAHDSGDSEVVFHCFGGETRYITRDGVKSLAETAGTMQWVLTGFADDPHGGFWVEAPVVELGEQELWEVTLKRNRRTKTIRATAGHKWLVRRPDRVVTTDGLKATDRLAHLRARQFDLALDCEAIRMGFVYGDGSIQQRRAATYGAVTLWGAKRDLAKYFDEIATRAYEVKTDSGIEGLRYTSGMMGYTKTLPALSEAPEYLYGWLAGYFAADGSVSRTGQVSLTSASLEALLHVRDIATVLGIGTYEPHAKTRWGFGGKSVIHSMDFMAEDLSSGFFLRDDQRARLKAEGNAARIGWTVESVRPTGKVEPVYCVRAHGTDTFTLEDNIHTGQCPFCGSGQVIARNDGTIECQFCQACFTVQVQPQYPAFPQTINGVPVNVPGMGPQWPGQEPPGGDPGQPVPTEEDQDADGVPDDQEEAPEGDSQGDDSTEGDGDANANPFAKKSMLYHTVQGAWLDEDQYMRHLALAHAYDRQQVLARIRQENEARNR